MNKNPILLGVVALAIAMLSCNTPQGQEVYDLQTKVAALLTATAAQGAAQQVLPAGGAMPAVPSAGPPPVAATPCQAMVTANQNANVRSGPGTVYDPPIGNLLAGQTALIDGKNAESTWWYIVFPGGPGGHGWISYITVDTSCLPPAVAIVVPPATPTEIVVVVTDVSVSVSPDEIGVPGCFGPIMPFNISATITTNGAIKLKYHFVTQQDGNLSSHTVNFAKAASKDVSEDYTPSIVDGKHWVKIVIEGMDLSGMDVQTNYKINC